VVTGVIAGAQLTVTRGAQKLDPFLFTNGVLVVAPIEPMAISTGNPITAVQAFPHDRCRLLSPPGSMMLQKAINPPKIIGPLCEGMQQLDITDLQLGATVEVTANGKTLVFGAATTSKAINGTLTFPQTVSARQNLCGTPGSWSALATVAVGSGAPVTPILKMPPDKATGVTLNPLLTWFDLSKYCNSAQSFDLEIAEDPAFTKQRQTFSLVSGTNSWTMATLKFLTTYWWRVRCNHNGHAPSKWAVFAFTTVADGGKVIDPPPPPATHDFCFLESCPGFFDNKRIVENAPTLAEAQAMVERNNPECFFTPIDCSSNAAGYHP
jgi:hypothetical protein